MASKHFIEVAQAQRLLLLKHNRSQKESRKLVEAHNAILSEDVFCPIDLPPFPQSSVDGFAIHIDADTENTRYKIVGESSAGHAYTPAINAREAVRIMTGAQIPDQANCIVMQEDCTVRAKTLIVHKLPMQRNQHMRAQASQLRAGTLALKKGLCLQAAALGLLASMGLTKVQVYRKPEISIITTGDELQQGGRPLKGSQVYESNAVALSAALHSLGYNVKRHVRCVDREDSVRAAVLTALEHSNYLIICGGVSVGRYDYVPRVLRSAKLQEVFYRVKQRPGKPLLYARRADKHVFALPGNPASVLCCFYEYVLPSLRFFSGSEQPFLPSLRVRLAHAIEKNTKLQHFVRARTDLREVWAADGQESYKMRSFAEANCLMVLESQRTHYDAGEEIEVHLLSSDLYLTKQDVSRSDHV